MSVQSYDSHFGITQDALARSGRRQGPSRKMSKEDYDRFMQSPAMMKQAVQEEAVAARTLKRDKKRQETDPSFKPEDADWDQAPAFKFDRRWDYYRTLGVLEYECQDNIKKAYRRLSLVYHPDKTRDLDDKTKDEYKQIFIELHNAYLVLSDNPTRRQYDRARDDQAISEEQYGSIGKKVKQFDAFLELERRTREKTKPAATTDVVLQVKLEKMYFGGIKRHMRARNREVFDGFVTDVLPYELILPPYCKDNYTILQRHAGDHHQDAKPDHLRFKLSAKTHPLVERDAGDLRLRQTVKLHKGAIEEAYMSLETTIMGGRALLLFGRNPFYNSNMPGTSHLHLSVLGEGFSEQGKLHLSVEFPSDHKAVERVRSSSEGVPPSKQMVVTVIHRDTGGECCVIVDLEATFGDVLEQMVEVLGLPGLGKSDFTLHKRLVFSDGVGPKLSSSAKVGSFNEVFCMGANWVSASLSPLRCAEIVLKLQEAVDAAEEAFLKKTSPPVQKEDIGDVSGAEPPTEVQRLLPFFGFPPSNKGLHNLLQAASVHEAEDIEELRLRLKQLAVGEAGGCYQPPPRRRKSPQHPVLRERQLRAQGLRMTCHTQLVPLGAPLELASCPSSRLEFYGNVGQPSVPQPGENVVRARSLYAVVLSCHRGAKKNVSREWAELLRKTMFLLVHTLWILVRPARSLMPLQLDIHPAAHRGEPAEVADSPMPWKRFGEEAFSRGDVWSAYSCFTRVANEAGFTDSVPGLDEGEPVKALDERVGGSSSSTSKVKAAEAVVRRADCLEHVGQLKAALADARAASILRPSWSKAWLKVGLLAARMGNNSEAKTALSKAVEFDPRNAEHLALLQGFRSHKSASKMAARAEKNAGNAVFKQKPSKAIACYTLGLSAVQAPTDETPGAVDQDTARLIAELYANRSGALAALGAWELALRDARRALALPGRQDWLKGLMRLGTALLGLGRPEEAYPCLRRVELALCLGAEEEHPVKRACRACLSLVPLWKSATAQKRLARFWKDGKRRPQLTKVFAVSDIHYGHPGADAWVSRISNTRFQEHVLIVAGDVADSLVKARQCLRQLRYKFRRLFFVPGNHDLWVHSDEEKEVPDSLAKLFALLQLCDELDVDVFPAAVCEDVFVVPLLSWYNADFDQDDPFPSSELDFDKYAKWPMDKDNYVWRYMLYLNRHFVGMSYPGTVLTCSHFLPRRELPYWNHVQGLIKAVGCPQLEPQLHQVQSRCHIFGHSHKHCDMVIEGVRYIQCPLGYQNEHSVTEPIRCVYDGSRGGLISKSQSIED